ncbi:MAG: hypothetical protein ACUVV6_07050 [Thermoplasmatota archaeon]
MAAAEDEWGGELTRFLDRPPAHPCLVPPAPSLCSVCGKLNSSVASVCKHYGLRHQRSRGETTVGAPGAARGLEFEIVFGGEDDFPDAPLIEYDRPRRATGPAARPSPYARPGAPAKRTPPAPGPARAVRQTRRAPPPEVIEAEVVEVVSEELRKGTGVERAPGPVLKQVKEPEKRAAPEPSPLEEAKKAPPPGPTEEERAALEEAEKLEREFLTKGKIPAPERVAAPAPAKELIIPTVAPVYKEPILKIVSAEPPKPPTAAPLSAPPARPLPPPPPGFAPQTGAAPPAEKAPEAPPPAPPAQPAPAPPPPPPTGRRTGGLYDILRKRGAEERKDSAPTSGPPAPATASEPAKPGESEEPLKKPKEIFK